MTDTHTRHHSHAHTHHSHAGPHGPHCEDELRRDVEEKREELGHTVEELAARADVKARARTRLREKRQQAEARRADLRTRALEAKRRVRSRTSSGHGESGYRPSEFQTAAAMTGTSGAHRADRAEETGETDHRKQLLALGGAALAACAAAGVMVRRSGHSPAGGRSPGIRPLTSIGTLRSVRPGGSRGGGPGSHRAGPTARVRSMTAGSHRVGHTLTRGPSHMLKDGLSHPRTGRGAPGGPMLRGMALRKGAAMAGAAPLAGAKVVRQGVTKGGALMRAGAPHGGSRSPVSGAAHHLAHSVAPDQGMAHRLEHVMGRGHHHHGPAGLWH